MKFVETLGLRVFSDSLEKIEIDKIYQKTLNTISPNSYGISRKDVFFKNSLINTDYLVLDGVYFSVASILLNKINIKKNQGPKVFEFFINKISSKSGRVFFLGSSNKTLTKIKDRLNKEHKNIKAGFYSPPFKEIFSKSDNEKMVEIINKFKPDILFVGMTCPKQEKWSYENKNKLNVKLVCCIGAVFDWYAGNQKEIHPIWWKLRLAWLIRTIDRPEIIKRYPNIFLFFYDLLLIILRIKKVK